MIYRVFASKDTFITNAALRGAVPSTGSNFGISETLQLFSAAAAVSGGAGWSGSSSLGRVLLQFDISPWNELLASGRVPAAAPWRVVLKDARHGDTLPASYDAEMLLLSRSWDEGLGIDQDLGTDLGQANWVQARLGVPWSVAGADILTSPRSTFHFDGGREDFDVDASQHFWTWASGTVPNNGVMVRVSSTLEAASASLYVKKFHARNTNFLDRRPYAEARWDDSILDDRANMEFDATGTLYLYNRSRGQLVDIPSVTAGPACLSVDVRDLSGTVLSVSASWVASGTYSASFSIASGSYSGSVFYDVWRRASRTYMTGSFTLAPPGAQQESGDEKLVATMPDMRVEYSTEDLAKLRVLVLPKDYDPPVVNTGSVPPAPRIVTRGYYRIDNDRTKEVVVPFGTGSYSGGRDWTRLSYDGSGNYFSFYMRCLAPGNVYRILLMFDYLGRKSVFDGGFKFKVVA